MIDIFIFMLLLAILIALNGLRSKVEVLEEENKVAKITIATLTQSLKNKDDLIKKFDEESQKRHIEKMTKLEELRKLISSNINTSQNRFY